MRKKIVAGNWKMNASLDEANSLLKGVLAGAAEVPDVELIVCPPVIYTYHFSQVLKTHDGHPVHLGVQNIHPGKDPEDHNKTAFTGETATHMVRDVGAEYCIVGHSERRDAGESDLMVQAKFDSVLAHEMIPILCCGEKEDQRRGDQQNQVVEQQLRIALENVSREEFIVAYEPVWAIGTGLTATPEQAQDMHAHIRSVLQELIGERSQDVAILYGGSCKPSNAQALFANPDIDGGLIGGAALKADSFIEIAKSFR